MNCLHYLFSNSSLTSDMLNFVIAKDYKVDSNSKKGFPGYSKTPLHLLVKNEHIEITPFLQILSENNIDPTSVSNSII